jgi:Bacterial regulatory proteins, tetR family
MAEADSPPERTFIEAARRNQIVAAAIDTIAEVGYARASFARIAARAGISPGLISYLYRFRTHYTCFELRLVPVGELGHDRDPCLSVCCT